MIAIAMVFIVLIGAVSGLGISGAVVQIEELKPAHLSSGFWFSLLTGLSLYAIVYIVAPHLAIGYGEPELEFVIISLGFLGIIEAVEGVPRALLVRHFRFRYLAFRSIFSTLVGGAIGITMAANGYGVWALVAQQLSMAIVRTVLSWLGAGWLPACSISWSPLKRLLSISLYLMGSKLSHTVSRQTDNLLIGTFLGTSLLGVYSIGFKVFETSNNLLLSSLSRLGLPTFSRLQSEPDRLTDAYQRASVMSAALSLPVFLLIMLTAADVVPFVFGRQWQESATVLQLLMIASCCRALINFDRSFLIARGGAKLAFNLTFLRATLNIVGFLVAVQWGINAVAAAFSIAALCMLPVWKFAIEKYSPGSIRQASPRFRSVGFGLIFLFGSVLLIEQFLPHFPTLVLMSSQWIGGLIAYSLSMYLLDRSIYAELRTLLRLGFGKEP